MESDELYDLEANKRDHKIEITDIAISKVPYIQYREIPAEHYESLQEIAKMVLETARNENDCNEVVFAYSLDGIELRDKDGEYLAVAFGDEHSVSPESDTDIFHLLRTAKDCVLVLIHNHPNLSKISLQDISYLLKYETINTIHDANTIIERTEMRDYTYIAGDFDHDKSAVDCLYWMNDNGFLSFKDAHDIQQSYDSSLPCSIKKSLRHRLENSYKFILIVGDHTDTVSKGGCQLCRSYNSYGRYCARFYTVDYRSFVKFECDKAVSDNLAIVVLYNSYKINRNLCPESVRWKGTHQ